MDMKMFNGFSQFGKVEKKNWISHPISFIELSTNSMTTFDTAENVIQI